MSQSFLFKAVVLNEISFNPEKGWMGSLLTEQEVSILSIQGSGSKYNEEYTNLISQTNVSILSIQGSGSKYSFTVAWISIIVVLGICLNPFYSRQWF
jgi:hypothetical protein